LVLSFSPSWSIFTSSSSSLVIGIGFRFRIRFRMFCRKKESVSHVMLKGEWRASAGEGAICLGVPFRLVEGYRAYQSRQTLLLYYPETLQKLQSQNHKKILRTTLNSIRTYHI
jgi:hypothetical protein